LQQIGALSIGCGVLPEGLNALDWSDRQTICKLSELANLHRLCCSFLHQLMTQSGLSGQKLALTLRDGCHHPANV